METKTNTGLGLMIATMQRADNQKSLFKSALKKLVNSNEKELADFLDKQVFLINPIKSISKGIKKGNYDWVYDYITQGEENKSLIKELEKVPQGGMPKEVEAELIHFGKTISTLDALKELDKMGYRPATERELLAFGAEYPEEQKKYPIAALPSQKRIDNDSVFRDEHGYCCALYLRWRGAGRDCDLNWLGSDWPDGWRFLAVRNK